MKNRLRVLPLSSSQYLNSIYRRYLAWLYMFIIIIMAAAESD